MLRKYSLRILDFFAHPPKMRILKGIYGAFFYSTFFLVSRKVDVVGRTDFVSQIMSSFLIWQAGSNDPLPQNENPMGC
ncbi:MAG: hypothetical protein ACJAVK_000368 [Akkermansiaceae bacterium]|jgi:hypothetical protein